MKKMNVKKKYQASLAEYIDIFPSDVIAKSNYEGEIDTDEEEDNTDDIIEPLK